MNFNLPRAKTVEVKCECCGNVFKARVADRKRGWARFCSKSCKAKKQEAKTGQYAELLRNGGPHERMSQHEKDMHDTEQGWDGHKDVF